MSLKSIAAKKVFRGKCKKAVASLVLNNKKKLTINGISVAEFIKKTSIQGFLKPLELLNTHFNVTESVSGLLKITGGGIKGQREAISLVIAQSLANINEDYRKFLKNLGLLKNKNLFTHQNNLGTAGKSRKGCQRNKR